MPERFTPSEVMMDVVFTVVVDAAESVKTTLRNHRALSVGVGAFAIAALTKDPKVRNIAGGVGMGALVAAGFNKYLSGFPKNL